ncbi:MAG: DUF1571 domain-containing protein [Deltaproteobacteria bacterium]
MDVLFFNWFLRKINDDCSACNAGGDYIINLFARDMKLIKAHPEWGARVVYKEKQMVNGVESYCIEAEMPKAQHPEFYAYKVRICGDTQTGLPNGIQIWDFADGKVRLVEDYSYTDIKINVGLTDKDFSPANPEYEF